MGSNYDPVADEYYDVERHPTSNGFSKASRLLLQERLKNPLPGGVVCEVGAGLSENIPLIARIPQVTQILVTDISEKMLSYSKLRFSGLAKFLICDARKIPIPDGSVDFLISSLGDPYNTPNFWEEANRVVSHTGEVFFTTPSWEWAKVFRSSAKNELSDKALFINKSGNDIYLESYILNEQDQSSLIEKFEFHVKSIRYFTLSGLGARDLISPKLSNYLNRDTPIVTSYSITR